MKMPFKDKKSTLLASTMILIFLSMISAIIFTFIQCPGY